jgi:hypothetical protein
VHFVFYMSFFIRKWNDDKLAKRTQRQLLQARARGRAINE